MLSALPPLPGWAFARAEPQAPADASGLVALVRTLVALLRRSEIGRHTERYWRVGRGGEEGEQDDERALENGAGCCFS